MVLRKGSCVKNGVEVQKGEIDAAFKTSKTTTWNEKVEQAYADEKLRFSGQVLHYHEPKK